MGADALELYRKAIQQIEIDNRHGRFFRSMATMKTIEKLKNDLAKCDEPKEFYESHGDKAPDAI